MTDPADSDRAPPGAPPEQAPPARALNRVTTEYQPVQDRVRLAGDPGDGSVLVLWLTQRLLRQLVPQLLEWLQKQDTADLPGGDELLHSARQQSATRRLGDADAAPVVAAEARAEWLVTAVDVQQRPEVLRLIFRAPQQHRERIVLDLRPLALRQWLHIVMLAYARAAWPLDVWPEWMREQLPTKRPQQPVLH